MSDFHYTPFNADATLCGISRAARPLSTSNSNAADCARCLAKLVADRDDELTECRMTCLHCEECGNTDPKGPEMSKLHITPTNYPGSPRCSRCDNSFQDGCFRVQRQTSNPKRWATIGWICAGCAA